MGCLVGGNRGARCPFPLPTMVTWQGRCAKCRPIDIFGVVQSRLLKVPLRRRHLIPCVLHLLIFVGRKVTALVRRLAKSVRPSTRVSVQAILHRSGCHIALYFEVPSRNGTSRSNLCNAQKLDDDVRAYFADEELW